MNFVLAHYLQSLPEEKRNALSHYYEGAIPSIEGAEILPPLQAIIEQMHPSHLVAIIQNFSRGDQNALLSVLSESQANFLKEELQIDEKIKEPSPLLKKFLLLLLTKALLENAPPLSPILPAAPLNKLLQLTHTKFQNLCLLLGLRDLANEVKKIIQSDKLKKIEAILSQDEKKELKNLLKGKEIVTFGTLNLQSWDGNEESLREVLQGRGINRLAKALYGENPTLIWHIGHKLEKSQSEMLHKLCVDPKNVNAQKELKNQVEMLIKENL